MSHDRLDVFGIQRAAATVAPQRAPISHALRLSSACRMPDAKWGQRLAIGFD